jgi:hypothetical protein
MAPPGLTYRDETGVGAQLQSGIYKEPLMGTVVSVILTLASLTILSVFISELSPSQPRISNPVLIYYTAQRAIAIKVWSRLPYVVWRT